MVLSGSVSVQFCRTVLVGSNLMNEKLQKHEIEKPNPNISTPTISNSNWEIPPPNSERMYHGNYFDSLPIASQNFPFALFHLQFYIRPERLTKQVL
ncbi:1220_t:CDS:2, partial [Rhizophagus irregularis]